MGREVVAARPLGAWRASGEAQLCWDPEGKALLVTDAGRSCLARLDPSADGGFTEWALPAVPGGVVARPGGRGAAVALAKGESGPLGVYATAPLDAGGGGRALAAELLGPLVGGQAPTAPVGEMTEVCAADDGDEDKVVPACAAADAAGRLWVGTRPAAPLLAATAGREGRLFCCEGAWRFVGGAMRRHAVAQRVDEVGAVPSAASVAFSPSRDQLYMLEVPGDSVAAYEFDAATARLGGRREVVRTAGGLAPTALAADAEGGLWVALAAAPGGESRSLLQRFDTLTGELRGEVRLPCACPTSVAFGGDGLERLYVGTSGRGGAEPEDGAVLEVEHGGPPGAPQPALEV